ncbi:MAG: glycosyltransferase family 2 protein, partial [Paracoccaceae bacterium]
MRCWVKITAVTTQKNEGAFLLEWIAYYKILGFAELVILSNDGEDGSDEMLDHLSKSGAIIHLRNNGPYDDRGIQFAALKRADRQKAVKEADWIMHLDIDEFLNIHVGDGQIGDLITALPEADAIALTWWMFGNNGIIEFKDRLITDQSALA